jgi:hypothetical protein
LEGWQVGKKHRELKNAGDGIPAVFAKRREVVEGEGDALRSFAGERKKCKRAASERWSVGKLEVQPGGEA